MCGLGARRNCEELILSGKVCINGEQVSDLGRKINIIADAVTVRGASVKPIDKDIHIALNKPRGIVVSRRGFPGTKTVFDLLPAFPANLNYAGRLDQDSEGLLILSTNGDLLNKLTHPRYSYHKIYLATLSRELTPGEITTFRNGMDIGEDEKTAPAQIDRLETVEGGYRIILHEGKNRQIRRMVESFGVRVRRLTRVAMGPINIGNLKSGAWRPLTETELGKIKRDLRIKI